MNVGITATRLGMTPEQLEAFRCLLKKLEPTTFHHGDCIGGDDEGANVAKEMGVTIICHPPVDNTHRAYNKHATETREAKTHFARNRDIVKDSEVLVVCPCDMTWQPKGGTWYTYDYAMKQGIAVYIVWPDGNTEHKQ